MSLMYYKNVTADGRDADLLTLHSWRSLCSYKKFAGSFYRSSSKSIGTCLARSRNEEIINKRYIRMYE